MKFDDCTCVRCDPQSNLMACGFFAVIGLVIGCLLCGVFTLILWLLGIFFSVPKSLPPDVELWTVLIPTIATAIIFVFATDDDGQQMHNACKEKEERVAPIRKRKALHDSFLKRLRDKSIPILERCEDWYSVKMRSYSRAGFRYGDEFNSNGEPFEWSADLQKIEKPLTDEFLQTLRDSLLSKSVPTEERWDTYCRCITGERWPLGNGRFSVSIFYREIRDLTKAHIKDIEIPLFLEMKQEAHDSHYSQCPCKTCDCGISKVKDKACSDCECAEIRAQIARENAVSSYRASIRERKSCHYSYCPCSDCNCTRTDLDCSRCNCTKYSDDNDSSD